jgi:hypothetical protein
VDVQSWEDGFAFLMNFGSAHGREILQQEARILNRVNEEFAMPGI